MTLSQASLALLLDLLEAKTLNVSAAAIETRGRAASSILEAGMLVASGHDAVVEDGAGRLVTVESGPLGLGYFEGGRWVPVREPSLRLFRLDVASSARTILNFAGLLLFPDIKPLDPDRFVWNLGITSFSSEPSPVWLARRLFDIEATHSLGAEAAARPADRLRLVLTSTPRHRLERELFEGCILVSLHDVIAAGEPARIDVEMLRARFAGQSPLPVGSPVHLSSDGRELVINGTVRILFRGRIQQELIRLFVEAYKKGKGLRAETAVAKAGSQAHSPAQVFKTQWPVLKNHLKPRSGLWYLQP